jgi:ATPase family associated with various cellular activities (AAA)
MSEPPDGLRTELGRLVRQLARESDEDDTLSRELRAHLGDGAAELPVLTEELQAWELPNLQLALDALLARPGWRARTVGLSGQARHYHGLSLGDLVRGSGWVPGSGPVEYVNAAIAPGRTMPCLTLALLIVESPDGPLVMFIHRGQEHGFGAPSLVVQAVATGDGVTASVLRDLRRAMDECDVYRGQVLMVRVDPRSGAELVFVERPALARDEVVLPDGVLDTIERHVVGPTRHREALLAAGRHLSRGVLLWGPPGTGKTHTVRYLVSLLVDSTVIILSGAALGAVGAFSQLARRLAPSLVVLEDVDLVAQERSFGPFGSSPVLFELMNQMDGVGEDADVAWVLTTNRADALEPALAARPGRVDLAVELPLPDDEARRRLFALYARGLELVELDVDAVVARTSGVPASFVKELLRKAALAAAEAGRGTVTGDDVSAALEGLLSETSALTRVLLGAAPAGGFAPAPHAWLEGYVGPSSDAAT